MNKDRPTDPSLKQFQFQSINAEQVFLGNKDWKNYIKGDSYFNKFLHINKSEENPFALLFNKLTKMLKGLGKKLGAWGGTHASKLFILS